MRAPVKRYRIEFTEEKWALVCDYWDGESDVISTESEFTDLAEAVEQGKELAERDRCEWSATEDKKYQEP